MPKRTKLIEECGPYHVKKRLDGGIVVYPTKRWVDIIHRMALAADLEAYLNAPKRKTRKK